MPADAVQSLNSSLTELCSQTSLQKSTADELIARLHGAFGEQDEPQNDGIESFVAETGRTLTRFIELIGSTANYSIEAVYRIDDIVREMDGVVAMVSKIKEIADQTNLLSPEDSVAEFRENMNREQFKVVHQSSIESGDVELFWNLTQYPPRASAVTGGFNARRSEHGISRWVRIQAHRLRLCTT